MWFWLRLACGGVLEVGACEGHPLLLAAAQLHDQAPLTDAHLVAVWHGQDLVVDRCLLRRLPIQHPDSVLKPWLNVAGIGSS